MRLEIAAGGAAHLDELLHLGMPDRQIDRGRTATQRALADRQRQAVHHADERDHARGFAVLADALADRAKIAPIGTDPAALRGEPHVLVPQSHDALEAVRGLVEKARDRQAATGAAVRQHGRRRHEPVLAHVVVDALGVGGVVAVMRGHTREQVLVALARQQVAVVERGAPEIGEQGVARAVDAHLAAPGHLHFRFKEGRLEQRCVRARVEERRVRARVEERRFRARVEERRIRASHEGGGLVVQCHPRSFCVAFGPEEPVAEVTQHVEGVEPKPPLDLVSRVASASRHHVAASGT